MFPFQTFVHCMCRRMANVYYQWKLGHTVNEYEVRGKRNIFIACAAAWRMNIINGICAA